MNFKKILASVLAIVAACTMSFAAMAIDEPEMSENYESEVMLMESENEDDVAFIGDTGYTTIADAINAATTGDTVRIAAGEYSPIDVSGKNITLTGTVENGTLLTTIKGGNPAISAHNFNGTIQNLKIKDAFKVLYGEPIGTVTFDNLYVTGATYGIHAVAYTTGDTWTIQNCYMDLAWANSFGVYGGGYANIIVKDNKFESTNPYYEDYGALFVNSFSPSVTIEDNYFGENAKIYIDKSVSDTSDIVIGNNFYLEGVKNAFADDEDGVTVPIYTAYSSPEMNDNEIIYNAEIVKAVIDGECFATLKDAIKAAGDGDTILLVGTIEEGSIKLPAVINNLTIDGQGTAVVKNTTINAADGNSVNYNGLTIKNTTFDNSRFVLGGMRNGDVIYNNLTFDNNKFINIVNTGNLAAIHMNISNEENEYVTNFKFTNNVIDGVTGSSNCGILIKGAKGRIEFSGNTIKNVVNNAIQFINAKADVNLIVDDNYLSSDLGAVLNLYNVPAITLGENEFVPVNGQNNFLYFTPSAKIGDVTYPSINAAIAAADENEVIVILPGTHTEEISVTKPVVLTGDPNYGKASLTADDTLKKPVLVINDITDGGIEYHAPDIVFDNLVFEVAEGAIGTGWNVSALGYYYEIVKDRNGLIVQNCDFINNSDIAMSAIAANLSTYTVKNNTFKGFANMVHSYCDHLALGEVVIDGNMFEDVDNIAVVYWGAENAAAKLAITNNTSKNGKETADIGIDDFGKTKTPLVTAIPTAVITGNDAEVTLNNIDSTNVFTLPQNVVYNYRSEDIIKALDGKLPNGTIYTGYNTDNEVMYLVENGCYKIPAEAVTLTFKENTSDADALDNSVWDIYLTANVGGILNRLNSADFTFALATIEEKDDMAYEIIASNPEIVINNVNNDENRFEFHYDGKTGTVTDTATEILIGTVKFTGFGGFEFAVDTTDVAENTNQVHTTTFVDNIVDSFIVGGITDAAGNVTNELIIDAEIDSEIVVPTKALTINIDFPNAVYDNAVAYQQMMVVLSGGELEAPLTINLGTDKNYSALDIYDNKKDASVVIEDLYTITITNLLEVNTAYTVTVSGAGYRTAKYTVTMTENKTLNFWNNVKDNLTEVEENKSSSAKNVTYLAGDIVKDGTINIYDLSAVVSYFGEIELVGNNNAYAKYDLNRDGKIDSKDVAYVLVSWGK